MNKIISTLIVLCLFSLISGCNQDQSVEEYINSGQEYRDKKEWKSAIIEFKNALKQAPDNATARALLGKTYLETQSSSAAIKELNRAIDLGYQRSELLLPLGLAYRQAGEHQKIIDEIKPGDNQSIIEKATIMAWRGISYLSLGNKESARSSLDQARDLDGEATEVRLAWATYEGFNGDIEAQERWLQPLLERDGGIADAWSQMGEIEQRRNNLDAADKAFTRAIELRVVPHYDYVRRATVRTALGNFDGAESDIDFLKKAGANWPMLGHVEGLINFENKEYAEAQIHFLEVLSKVPNYPPSQLMAGLSFFYQQNYQNTITYLDQYFVSDPDNLQAKLVYATSLLATQNSGKALTVLQDLDSRDPNNFRILALLSEAYLRQGKDVESLQTLQKAVKINPDQASTRLQLGSTLVRKKDTAAMGQLELKKAIELDPGLNQAKLTLFMSYIRGKQFAQALETAKNIESSAPDQSMGANLIALTYLAEGKDQEAKQQLLKTLDQFPVDKLTSHNLARIYIQEKAYADARALYLKVIENEPNHMGSLQQMALISARQGNSGDMMQWLQKAVDRNPRQTQPKLTLASQFLQQGNSTAAIQVLNDVDVEDKESVGFILLMSRAKLGVGEVDHAQRLLKTLVKQQPKIVAAHFLLAQVYAAKNDAGKMREELEQTVLLVPDHLMAQVFLARLDLVEGKDKAFNTRLAALQKNYPGNVEVELLKAQQSSTKKDYDSAIEVLSGLLAEVPQTGVVIELSRNQWQSGDKQGAISSLELWSESNKDSRVLLLLAEFYLLENRNEEATATYQVLEQELPDNAAVLNNLAWSLKDSNPGKGLEYAQKADRLDPDNPAVMDTLAMLLMKNGKNARALEVIEQTISKAPDVLEIQLNYADILAANNRTSQAKKVLKEALQKTTDPDKKRLIDQRLKSL
jgi:putative PEP-CTERM system TPR-repeat lipoprotein